jgi:2-hydroxy-palmitic acid dioxygenase Mpo1-like protein
MTSPDRGPLLAWQWSLYPDGHRDRRNLAIHVATQPLFVAGVAALLAAAPVGVLWLLGAGPAAMVLAMALQGRGHKLEQAPPVPFRGPLDVLARIFAEQLITWPRFVLSGGLARAWRGG